MKIFELTRFKAWTWVVAAPIGILMVLFISLNHAEFGIKPDLPFYGLMGLMFIGFVLIGLWGGVVLKRHKNK